MAGKKRCAYVPPPPAPSPAPASDADTDPETSTESAPQPQPERCKNRAAAFAGDCTHCEASFCSQHRYPEHHNCPGRDECRMQELKRLKDKLMSEQTVASKIVMA